MDIQEKDLYLPIEEKFKSMGYEVKGEVKDCDIMAVSGDKTVVVELKKTFSLKLVYQLLDRQTFCKNVYAAIPRPKSLKTYSYKSMVRLLKRIDAGLILVSLARPIVTADIVLDPSGNRKITSYKKKRSAENEFSKRDNSLNAGGINREKIITAYREMSLEILCICYYKGTITNKILREIGFDNKYISVPYKNYYGWFQKTGRGEYTVSEKGKEAAEDIKYKSLIEVYKEKHNL